MTSLAALLAAVGEKIATLLSALWSILKFLILITLAYSFFVAIKTILDLIAVLVNSTIIGEIFALTSMYLPFNAAAVFGAISFVMSGIITFLIARKIFNMYKEVFAAAN